ncbi:response regulator transcription factor [Haloimpatiens sp. FM7330]|uniref:response regulator transcription factor n=1 Tax=Haloimpatiens sp. FM7330 TaxID=3298610 RepID=UPI003642F131
MYNKKILIIEDEEPIADLLSYSLKKEGFRTEIANEGKVGINKVKKFIPDMILLDLMLPDISGFDVCREISKNYSIPIVMITAKSDTMDKILGIELGADDYITKPFNIREAIARIKAIFRRIELTEEHNIEGKANVIKLKKGIEIYKEERKVLKDDVEIDFTNKEFELLTFLAENKKRIFSRSELLDKVWGFEYAGDTRTVDIHVQRIRKKLDEDKKSSVIETVFGIGYKLID